MTSRRPPSQRNTEYAVRHQGRHLQSMSPGALAGKLASAQPIGGTGSSSAEAAAGSGGGDGGERNTEADYAYDVFTLAAATPTLALTYLPIKSESVHVYLNGLEQREGIDYLLSGKSLAVLAAMDAESSDVLEARYVYLVDMPDEPEDDLGSEEPGDPEEFTSGELFVDTGEHDMSIEFDWVGYRTWTPPNEWAIFAVRSPGGGLGHRYQKADAEAMNSDYALTQTSSGQHDVNFLGVGAGLHHYKISIIGDTFEILRDGVDVLNSDSRPDVTYPELTGATGVYIDTAGGSIANLVITGIP